MTLSERIYHGLLNGSRGEIRKGDCTKEKFVRSCDIALGAFKLSSWSGIDTGDALRLVACYWDYAENNPAAGSALTMDESINALSLILKDECPEYLLGMPVEKYFPLVTCTALDNMTAIVEEYGEKS